MSAGRVKKDGVGEEFFLLKLWKNYSPHAGQEVFLVNADACSFEQWRDAGDGRRHKEQLDDGEVVYGRMRDNAVELFLVYLQDGRLGYNTALQPILETQGKVVTKFDHRSHRRFGRVIANFKGHLHEGRSLSASPKERRPREASFQPLTSRQRSSSAPPSNRRQSGRRQIESSIPRHIIREMARQVNEIVLPSHPETFLFGKHDLKDHSFHPILPPGLSKLHHSNQHTNDGRIPHPLPAKPPPPKEWTNQSMAVDDYSPTVSSGSATPTNTRPNMNSAQTDATEIKNFFAKGSKTHLELSLDAVSRSVSNWATGRRENNIKVGCTDFAYIADPQGKPLPGERPMLLIVVVAEKDFHTHKKDRFFTAAGVDYPRIGYIENGEPQWTCSESVWKQFFIYGAFDRYQGAGPEVMAILQNSKVDDYTEPGPRPNILDDVALEEQRVEQKAAKTEKTRLKKLAAREKAREKKAGKEAGKENVKPGQKKGGK